jgi:hypothetical protein
MFVEGAGTIPTWRCMKNPDDRSDRGVSTLRLSAKPFISRSAYVGLSSLAMVQRVDKAIGALHGVRGTGYGFGWGSPSSLPPTSLGYFAERTVAAGVPRAGRGAPPVLWRGIYVCFHHHEIPRYP